MQNLETISKSIQAKRRADLDTESFPLSKLTLATYDIRRSRGRNPKLKKDLDRDGQFQAITVNIRSNGNDIKSIDDIIKNAIIIAVIVNGRTRKIEMDDIFTSSGKFKDVKVEIYVDLTEMEEDYLNAQINISQNPLTGDEKIEFVKKYMGLIDPVALREAIGVGETQIEYYLEVAVADAEVLEEFRPANDGYDRSEIKIEEYAKMSKAVKQAGVTPDNALMKALGKQSAKCNLTRDAKRIKMPKLAKRSAELYKNPSITSKFTVEQIVEFADKETSVGGSSGDKLPQNSSEKYKIINSLLKGTYEFAVIFFAEGLYRTDDDGNSVESETKRIIDEVDEVILIGNEIEKLIEAQDYAIENGKSCTIHVEDAIEICEVLKNDDRRGFVYVNGAMLYAQRPEFMNYLKAKYSKSIVAMVVLDLLFGKSQVYGGDRVREIITVYGGADNFNEVIAKFKKIVKFSKFRKYADTPQEKHIVFI
jgi:hypothetical protein